LTSFIGRERELAEVRRLLSTARLVTVTGAGGSGKTRLALQAASTVGETFADGAHFISLGAIRDPTLIIPTIAQALGLVESPGQLLFDSLKDFLRDRQMLLLLDNFEQLISAAPLLTEVLAACAGLKLLVTSRETLRVRGEYEFPLALGDPALLPDRRAVETLLHSPAIALFVERAQASQPDSRFTADNAAAVAKVHARLGETAFAQALAEGQTMTVADLLAIPQLPAPDSPARSQPAPASVSYEPLTARELDVLRLLAQDLSNPQIAERLVVSRRTVDAHLRSIYAKLGVKSRDAAIRLARDSGLM
jgi:predicted ATPase/DNA-binding CsgD family transcriptional regulator